MISLSWEAALGSTLLGCGLFVPDFPFCSSLRTKSDISPFRFMIGLSGPMQKQDNGYSQTSRSLVDPSPFHFYRSNLHKGH